MASFSPLSTVLVAFALLSAPVFAAPQQASPPSSQAQPSGSPSQETQAANEALTPEATNKLAREVRHELIMLPYYGVFDNLEFRLDGRTVTLIGQVVNPTTKTDAGNVVKRIEGVEKVVNNIEVLPPSPSDERIRRAVYRAIYSYGPLFKYGNMAVPPIHIIVRNGRIALEGVVDTESDKNLAGMRASTVPGTFAVTNNLRVLNSSNSGKKQK